MMYGNEFDGAAAFSGGGFMPSQATQTAVPGHTTYSKNRDTQTLIPLTVKQISQALSSDDERVNFLIDGIDVNNVKMVGMVLNKSERVTDVSLVLDDGTGRIECNRWVNDQADTKEMESIMTGTYVRIHGQLKGIMGKKQLVIFGIKPVTDFDEITHHFVECIYVHSYNTKLMKSQASSSTQAHIPSSAVNTQAYQTAPPNQFSGRYSANVNGFSPIQQSVFQYLQLPGSLARENGVHQEELVQQLGIPMDKILAALNFLIEEGVVYQTSDEFHYKTTLNA